MQFTLMRTSKDSFIPKSDLEVHATLEGDIIGEESGLSDTSWELIDVNGTKVIVHLSGNVKTPLGTGKRLSFEVPVIFRESSLVLIGSDGESSVENAALKVLHTFSDIKLQPLIPVREQVMEMLEHVRRFEAATVVTEKGPMDIQDAISLVRDPDDFPQEELTNGLREVLLTYPLISANLVFQLKNREVFLRYYLDSLWLDEKNGSEIAENLISILEGFLLSEDV